MRGVYVCVPAAAWIAYAYRADHAEVRYVAGIVTLFGWSREGARLVKVSYAVGLGRVLGWSRA